MTCGMNRRRVSFKTPNSRQDLTTEASSLALISMPSRQNATQHTSTASKVAL